MEIVTCNFCGSSRASTWVDHLQDWLLGNDLEVGEFVRCEECGLIYLNPRFSREEIGRFYPENYDPFQTAGIHFFRKITQSYSTQKRTRLITSHLSAGRILDIGCATGEFLAGIQKTGDWQTQGVEPDKYAASIASKKPGLKIFQGFLKTANFEDNYFDVVTLWDVLEHLPDPLGDLEEIQRILKPGGLVVIRVPNAASVEFKRWGKFWAGLDYPRHLYLFSPQTLSRHLQKAGFEVSDHNTNVGAYPTWLLSLRFRLQDRYGAKTALNFYHLLGHPFFQLLASPWFLPISVSGHGPLLVMRARKSL